MKVLFLSLFLFFHYSFSTLLYTGVNLAGGEFSGSAMFPNTSSVDYFFSKGMNIIRLPFLWERVQPSLNGTLDPTEMGIITNLVNYITITHGGFVILDPHNYARYNNEVIGQAGSGVTAANFADFWTRMSSVFKNNSHAIFGLMNEPNTMSTELWVSDANIAIAAIRATGAANLILCPGNAWTGAHSWDQNWYGTPNSIALLNITDPGNNIAFEVHQYFDSNYSGTSATCISPASASSVFTDFTNWLIQNNKKGFLGEFGAAANSLCESWVTQTCSLLANNSDYYLGWTWWAGGNAWPSNYIYLLQPSGYPGNWVDAPQMAYLQPYIVGPLQTTAQLQTTVQQVTTGKPSNQISASSQTSFSLILLFSSFIIFVILF